MTAPATPPRIIGHRGAAGHAPENTLPSIRKAFDLGVTWVEVDVKLSADGEAVLLHDDGVERTTDGRGRVRDLSLRQLKSLDAGRWFAAEFAGTHIPTLAELVVLLSELNMGVNLELKPSPGLERETGRIVAEIFNDLWPAGAPPPLVSSFEPAALEAFASVIPGMARALLVKKLPADWRRLAGELGAAAMHCAQRHAKRHHVEAIREAGLPVRCFTVNEPRHAARLFHWGVDGVFTDFPERLS